MENFHIFNFVMLGNFGVGKTTFMMTFIDQKPFTQQTSKKGFVNDV